MANTYYPPNATPESDNPKVFLGGTIDMGNSDDWQTSVIDQCKDYDVDFYNPRRADWDSTWKQSIDDENFNAQVRWELDHINECDVLVFVILADSKSPITLMEIGIAAGLNQRVLICCEQGYWRRGNVEVMADYYSFELFDEIEDLVDVLKNIL